MVQALSSAYLKTLGAISDVAIIAYTNLSGQILYSNEKFCEISGYTAVELFMKNHRILNSGYHSSEFFKNLYSVLASGQNWRGEIRNKTKNGSYYWVDTQIMPFLNDKKEIEGYVSIRFDITEKKKLEESIIHLEKMASLGEMASVIAHEINNPLTIIELSLRNLMVKSKTGDLNDEEMRNKILKISNAADRVTKLIKGLKNFSRNSENDSFSSIPLKNIFDDTFTYLIPKYDFEKTVIQIAKIPDVNIECRPNQISQILINLIGNAIDAIEDKHVRWIHVEIELIQDDKFISISVVDSGDGISEEDSEKIMLPFYTTKDPGKGTGLGLSISKAIAENHGGALIYKKINGHSAFNLTIPLIQSVHN